MVQQLIKRICMRSVFALSITCSVALFGVQRRNTDIEQKQNQSYISLFMQKLKDDYNAVSPEYRLAFVTLVIGVLAKKNHDDYYVIWAQKLQN